MTEEIKWAVGDQVVCFGCEGEVIEVRDSWVKVKLIGNDGHPEVLGFQLDGRLFEWAKEVSLNKVGE